MPKEAFAQLQEEERRKDQNKSNNKIRLVSETIHGNNNIAVTDQRSNLIFNNHKKEEDDFVVDYHYGDSISNDEEVARISAVTSEQEDVLKIIHAEEETANMANNDLKVNDHNIISTHGSQRQQSGSVRSTRSSGSYEPSIHSALSTSSIDDHSCASKASPIHYKIVETPPLLKFDAVPPTKISSANISRPFYEIQQPQGSSLIEVNPSVQSGITQRKRNLSDTSLHIHNNVIKNTSAFSKISAFDPISVSNTLQHGSNKIQIDSNSLKGVVTSTQSHISENKKTIGAVRNNVSLKPEVTHTQVLPQGLVFRSNSNGDVGKPTFTLTPTTNSKKTFIVQSTPSKSNIIPNMTVSKANPLVVTDGSTVTKQKIIVSKTSFQPNQTIQRISLGPSHSSKSIVSNIQPPHSTMENVSKSTSTGLHTSANQPKQAVLAQINGRQVLLIPKQEDLVQNKEKITVSSTVTSQIGKRIVSGTQVTPQYKIVKSISIPKIQTSLGPADVNTRITSNDDEQSKLERCLRYGSAAVEKAVVTGNNTSAVYTGTQNPCNDVSKNVPLDPFLPMKIGKISDVNALYEKQFTDGRNRESIESMRRDSSDSGKSDIITSSTIDPGMGPSNQQISQTVSNLILSPSGPRPHVEKEAVVLTNDIVLEGGRIMNVKSITTNNHTSTAQPNASFLRTNNGSTRYTTTTNNVPIGRIYKTDDFSENVIDVHGELKDPYPNLSLSSDSGFAEQSPNVTPQSIRFYNNSNNVYHLSS